MYFSGRQLYSHNRRQRNVHLQDFLWSRKVCVKVYTKTAWYLANGLKLQVEKKMFDIAISKSVSAVDEKIFISAFLEFCMFFVCFNKQIQGYFCFTMFFLQQPAIYAVLLLQGNFWISDFSAQHIFFIHYYSKHV